MPDDSDLLHAELDRQLAEVRASCDGLATRSGLLVAAAGVAAAILAPHVQSGKHQSLLVVTLVIFVIATIAGAVTLMPWLKIGALPSALAAFMRVQASITSAALYATKVSVLEANLTRLLVMRIFFSIQAAMTLIAVGLALIYSAGK